MSDSRTIDVLLAPSLWRDADLRGKLVLSVDTLRATSSMTMALESGAAGIIPVADEAAAHALRAQLGKRALLCGEAHSVRIPGFDLGNSPWEMMEETVYDRILVYLTRNGTRALLKAREGAESLLLCLLNVSAAAREVAGTERDVVVLAAGGGGKVCVEDTLAAGYFVQALRMLDDYWEMTDGAVLALRTALSIGPEPRGAVLGCEHGRELVRLGFERDVVLCSTVDRCASVGRDKGGMVVGC